ncbi:hypothetical protein BDF20DRAFT_842298 [Mycotypha africana]|uniref:uncharacterized protein n=1 Tax=Mycotypha africana TaxID=64632 RepID=UPI002300DDFA|nr:uncharacterized protein BDF20DRAFT_842298 [Mycotypha africana]KAI8991033.1 hypothetical protein BDF20DRAFT_842298 [Mycotypha africana]
MNPEGAKLEELYEKTNQAATDEERKRVAQQMSALHKQVSGFDVHFDEHGFIPMDTESAKRCPRTGGINLNVHNR